MIIKNEDIGEIALEAPEGHGHLRTTVRLKDGSELVFQEAAIANIVRAYVTIKTHPLKTGIRLRGEKLIERKKGYAEWQLLESEREEKR
ncbi:MAG: hypothetical protein M1497_10980 [Nitrospirae bacterium]|nr:hypothetical protein [Nitrospirota bacterium]